MSHIAKKPIKLPKEVSIEVQLPIVSVQGPLGKSSITLPTGISCIIVDQPVEQLIVSTLTSDNLKSRELKKRYALWGTYRTLINNMVIGVSQGFSIKLELVGVGYRAQVVQDKLRLKLGYSHMIDYPIPADVTIECVRPNLVLLKGIDRQRVHQTAAEIRRYRKPEPYKGKGIRYEGEVIRLKEGKKK